MPHLSSPYNHLLKVSRNVIPPLFLLREEGKHYRLETARVKREKRVRYACNVKLKLLMSLNEIHCEYHSIVDRTTTCSHNGARTHDRHFQKHDRHTVAASSLYRYLYLYHFLFRSIALRARALPQSARPSQRSPRGRSHGAKRHRSAPSQFRSRSCLQCIRTVHGTGRKSQ